jgi:hypothetical protein
MVSYEYDQRRQKSTRAAAAAQVALRLLRGNFLSQVIDAAQEITTMTTPATNPDHESGSAMFFELIIVLTTSAIAIAAAYAFRRQPLLRTGRRRHWDSRAANAEIAASMHNNA